MDLLGTCTKYITYLHRYAYIHLWGGFCFTTSSSKQASRRKDAHRRRTNISHWRGRGATDKAGQSPRSSPVIACILALPTLFTMPSVRVTSHFRMNPLS